MCRSQMQSRCPGSIYHGKAMLHGHSLAFNRKGTRRDGAVASIVQAHEKVHGIIWELSDNNLKALSAIEDPTAYKPVYVRVVDEDGEEFDATAFVSTPEPDPPDPDPDYVDILLKAAIAEGFPQSYIEQIKKISKIE